MNTLKNAIVEINPMVIRVGYSKDTTDFESKEVVLEKENIDKINDLINVVNGYLQPEKTLNSFLCQITADQHMSEERIRYVDNDDNYDFINICSISEDNQNIYNQVKKMLEGLI